VYTCGMQVKEIRNASVRGKEDLSEDFPGPIKLPTRFVFDLKLALSFNCQ
jgi:hypothetical protein